MDVNIYKVKLIKIKKTSLSLFVILLLVTACPQKLFQQTTSNANAIYIADGVCGANQCYGKNLPMFDALDNEMIDNVEDILNYNSFLAQRLSI